MLATPRSGRQPVDREGDRWRRGDPEAGARPGRRCRRATGRPRTAGVLALPRCSALLALQRCPPARCARTAAAPTPRGPPSRSTATAPSGRGRSCATPFLPGFADDVPYVIVDVELDAAARTCACSAGSPTAPTRRSTLGDRVTVAFDRLDDEFAVPAFTLAGRERQEVTRDVRPQPVAIAGYAQSPIVRHADRTLGAIAVDTARAAIADAGLARRRRRRLHHRLAAARRPAARRSSTACRSCPRRGWPRRSA